MSNYTSLVHDFPQRCKDLLPPTKHTTKQKSREVTITLMVASAGFIVPYERLRPDSEFEHPSADREKFPQTTNQFDALLDMEFLGSPLWPDKNGSWSSGSLKSVIGMPDSWDELQSLAPLAPNQLVKDILSIVRIALAHGNVYTKSDGKNNIVGLVFVSGGYNRRKKRMLPYRYAYVSPDDFRAFLLNWLRFLEKTDIPKEIAFETIEIAA